MEIVLFFLIMVVNFSGGVKGGSGWAGLGFLW